MSFFVFDMVSTLIESIWSILDFLILLFFYILEDYPSPAEGNGLENRQACKSVRGFESHILLRLEYRGMEQLGSSSGS